MCYPINEEKVHLNLFTDHVENSKEFENNHDDKYSIERSVFIRFGCWIRYKEMNTVLHLVEDEPVSTHNEQEEEHSFTPMFHHDNNPSCNNNKKPIVGVKATWIISCPNISLEKSDNTDDDVCDNKEDCCSFPKSRDIHLKFRL